MGLRRIGSSQSEMEGGFGESLLFVVPSLADDSVGISSVVIEEGFGLVSRETIVDEVPRGVAVSVIG